MTRNMNKGLLAAGVVGATIGMYKMVNMNPKNRRKMMKKGRRAVGAMSVMKGMNLLQ